MIEARSHRLAPNVSVTPVVAVARPVVLVRLNYVNALSELRRRNVAQQRACIFGPSWETQPALRPQLRICPVQLTQRQVHSVEVLQRLEINIIVRRRLELLARRQQLDRGLPLACRVRLGLRQLLLRGREVITSGCGWRFQGETVKVGSWSGKAFE